MPKLKRRKGAVKRFKLTKSGKVKRRHAKLRHILTSKTTKNKRHLRADAYVSKANEKSIRRLLLG